MSWLACAQRLQFIAQAGLTYSRDPYDRERFEQIQAMAAEILAEGAGWPAARSSRSCSSRRDMRRPKWISGSPCSRTAACSVREASDGRWSLPGGWADVGDTPSAVAVREAKEESGYDVRVTKLLAVLDKARHDWSPALWYTYKISSAGSSPGERLSLATRPRRSAGSPATRCRRSRRPQHAGATRAPLRALRRA